MAYLFNPFAILSCVAGTLTSAENAAVMLALAGGCLRNGPLAGFGLALGGYLGLHPLLLLVSDKGCMLGGRGGRGGCAGRRLHRQATRASS